MPTGPLTIESALAVHLKNRDTPKPFRPELKVDGATCKVGEKQGGVAFLCPEVRRVIDPLQEIEPVECAICTQFLPYDESTSPIR